MLKCKVHKTHGNLAISFSFSSKTDAIIKIVYSFWAQGKN